MATPKFTNTIIEAAIDGFEAQKGRIDIQIAELRAMLSGSAVEPASKSESTKPARRKMSAAGRRAIAAAQRARWAALKGEVSEGPQASKPKRKMSAAGRANIVAA